MSTTFFCPFCGLSDQQDNAVCPRCKKSLEHWKEHPFEERLILTLRHPLREHRMMAVRLLGQRRYARAIPFFAEMMEEGQDVYTLGAIISALRVIDTPESCRLADTLKNHPSPVVQAAFRGECSDSPGRGRP